MGLADTGFRVRSVVEDALVGEAGEVDGAELAVQDELGEGAADAEGVHEAVPGESAGEVEVVRVSRPVSDDHVPVQAVLVLQTRPRGGDGEPVQGVETGDGMRPDPGGG